jgi:hypothetical protein
MPINDHDYREFIKYPLNENLTAVKKLLLERVYPNNVI